MTKPILYLMLGYPGAGKTTVSEYIAELTHAVHLNSDQFRRHMFKNPLEISEAEHENMYEMLDHITELTLQSGKSVIYDANLNKYSHRREKYDICTRIGAEPKLIWIKTNEAEARKRATIDAKKHPAHRPFGNMEKSTFDRLIKQIEPPKKNENAIVINGDKIKKEEIKKMLKESLLL